MKITKLVVALSLLLGATLAGNTAQADPAKPRPDVSQRRPLQEAGAAESVSDASPWALPDTQNDVPYGSGDITAIKVEHLSTSVRLTLRTRAGSNPSASDSWVYGLTFIDWAIDVNNDGLTDFYADLWNDGADVQAEVYRSDSALTHRCWADWAHPNGTAFILSFPRSCISSHLSFRVNALMVYDRYPFGPQPVSQDYSPNSTWSPRVTR